MKKLRCVKLANSIKCGTREDTFFSESQYEIFFDMPLIAIKDPKTEDVTETSIYNAIYWKSVQEAPAKKKAGA